MENIMKEYKLAYKPTKIENRVITCVADAFDTFKSIFDKDTAPIFESFYVIYLNKASKTKGFLKISQGGISETAVDVRLIMIGALESLATSMIIAHNHPSGSITPSERDKKMTSQIREAATLLNIQVLDHLILSGDLENYISFAEECLF